MATVATQNFRLVERILNHPPPAAEAMFQQLGGRDKAKQLLRYEAGEMNRHFFELWEFTQLLLGVTMLVLLAASRRWTWPRLSLLLAMLLITAVQRFSITPQVVRLGQRMEFGAQVDTGVSAAFWRNHGLYSGGELVKWGSGLVLAALLLIERGSGTERRRTKAA